MAAREAARELLDNTDLLQQRQVLLRMKPHRAAALLEVSLEIILSRVMLELPNIVSGAQIIAFVSCGISPMYLIYCWKI